MNTPHLIEIALLMLAAFLIGCVIGYYLRKIVGGPAQSGTPSGQATAGEKTTSAAATSSAPSTAEASAETKSTSEKPTASKPVKKETPKAASTAKASTAKAKTTKPAATKAKPAPKTETKSTAEVKKPAAKPAAATDGKPETLSAPREGGKDDLKNIKGIGPKIEGILNGMGIYHFDQIAAWGRKEVKWVDEELSFKGRIDREKWIAQAKKLAKDAGK